MSADNQSSASPLPVKPTGLEIIIGCLGSVLLLLGAALALYAFFHPIRLRGILVVAMLPGAPLMLWTLARVLRLRHLPFAWMLSGRLINKAFSWIGRILGMPFGLCAFLWFVVFRLFVPEGPDQTEWINGQTNVLVPLILFLQIIDGYVCVALDWPKTGFFLSLGAAYVCLRSTLGGLSLENGVLNIFRRGHVSASPNLVLSSSLAFATAFGALHYAVSSLDASQYNRPLNVQDSLYFSFITATTVGYGDILPAGRFSKWLCIAEVATAFSLLVIAVNATITVWLQRHQPKDVSME